jgi:hypothetical protein
MITKQKLIDDIVLQLNQGAVSDDSELSKAQVAQWIQYHLHDLIKREIVAEMTKGNMIPPIYIIREDGFELSEENVVDMDENRQRMWVELANDVLDLPKDSGLVQVLDYDYNLVYKASLERMHMINSLPFAKSSPKNLLYFRQGKKIFVEGLQTSEIPYTPVIVDYVPKQDILALNDTDEVVISDQLIPVLIDLCVQQGKLMLYGTQVDEQSDGVDSKKPAYHTSISNPSSNQSQPE